jgi:lipid A 3-O-deacylase
MPVSSQRIFLFASLLLTLRPMATAQTEISPRGEADGRAFLVHGGVSGLFDSEKNPALALEYRWARVSDLELRPWLGAGWATDGAVFVAVGVARSWRMDDRWRLCAGFGPAYYDRHEGLDLGSSLEFYSFVEMECRAGGAHGVVFRLAHISNGGLADSNPGTELLSLGYRIRLP